MKLPLQQVLEAIYKENGNNRKNSGIAKLQVENFGWNQTTTKAWDELREAISNASQLSHHNDLKQQLVLYTDASITGWSGILCQIHPKDISKSPEQRDNQTGMPRRYRIFT